MQQKLIVKCLNEKTDISYYDRNREALYNGLKECGFECIKPEGAFYLFVKVPEGWDGDDMAFTNHLKKFNILCAPGSGFGGKGWFRIAYCCSEQTILNSREAFKKARETGRS